MSDDEKLLALLKKLPTELAIPVLKLSLKIDRLVEERDRLRAALEADREGREGYEEVEAVHWGGGITYSPDDDPHEIAAAHDHCRVVKILVPASPEADEETPRVRLLDLGDDAGYTGRGPWNAGG